MRIADAHMYRSMNSSITKSKDELARTQEQAATGLRVTKPSDDPGAAAAARREASQQKLAEGAAKNADLANTRLVSADDALGSVSDLLGRARELMISGTSDTSTIEQRSAAAAEVDAIRQQILTIGNTRSAGSYVFSGERDQTAPFASDGSFVGDAETRKMELMPGVPVEVSASAGKAFGVGGSGVSIMSALENLSAAFRSNDISQINAAAGDLDTVETQVLDARSSLGIAMNNVGVAKSVAERTRDGAKLEQARLTEADEVGAITDLVKAKSAYDTALAVAQKLPVGSLATNWGG
jgi:flagellar hook-associated protein 3 FlgL